MATENQENWDELEKKRRKKAQEKKPRHKNGSAPSTPLVEPENRLDEYQGDNKKKQESE